MSTMMAKKQKKNHVVSGKAEFGPFWKITAVF
jgi:hypothetical protein